MEIGKLSIISKAILLSCSVSLLSACGGSSDNPVEITKTIEKEQSFFDITVIDGYIRGAVAYIDLNNNKIRDNDEPFVVTTEGGQGKIDITDLALSPESISIIVDIPAGAIDESTITDENPDGIAITDETAFQLFSLPGQDIATPLTTLVIITAQEAGVDIPTAITQVADNLNITIEQVTADYIDAKDTQLAVLNELLIANSVIPKNITQGVDAADAFIAAHVASKLSTVIQVANTAGNFTVENTAVIDKVAKVTTAAITTFTEKNKAALSTATLPNFKAVIEGISQTSIASFQPLITATETVNETDIVNAAQQANIMTDVIEHLLTGYVAEGVTTDLTDDTLKHIGMVVAAVKTTIDKVITSDKNSEKPLDTKDLTDIATVTAVAVTETLTSLTNETLTEQEIATTLADNAQITAQYLEEAIKNDIEINDFDGDGIVNDEDSDIDGDQILNAEDAFDFDATESVDTDGDNIGNNADTDDDGDNVADADDAFPLNKDESVDTDGDNIGNNADTDDDGDNIVDADDAFPLNKDESVDTDGDNIGNNADTDDDGDNIADADDAFPLDKDESVDTDGDNIGNNADTDDDGDGVLDIDDAFPEDNTLTTSLRVSDIEFTDKVLRLCVIDNYSGTTYAEHVYELSCKDEYAPEDNDYNTYFYQQGDQYETGEYLNEYHGNGIYDLTGISALSNLTALIIPEADISDVALLANLTKLKTLDLTLVEGTDISLLSSLVNLEAITLPDYSLDYFATLSVLPKLKSLTTTIDYPGKGDREEIVLDSDEKLATIANLTSLETLNLVIQDGVSSLAPLSTLSNLKHFELNNYGEYSTLTGLTSLSNLATMVLTYPRFDSEVADLTSLSNLTSLTMISSAVGPETFISLPVSLQELSMRDSDHLESVQFEGLINLERLELSNVGKSPEISALAALTNLIELDLSGNNYFDDISVIAELTNLKELSLSDNYSLNNISALADLTNLETLNLSSTSVDDIFALAGLASLEALNIYNTDVTELSAINSLTSLKVLSLEDLQIDDITPLASLVNLEVLNIASSRVTDLSPLSSLSKLETLNITRLELGDLIPLENLTSLKHLKLERTDITDISSLASLVNLEYISLADTDVADLSPLTDLVNLDTVFLDYTLVEDLTPLNNLTNIKKLNISASNVSNLTTLANLTQLEYFKMGNRWNSSEVTEEINLTPLTNLFALKILIIVNSNVVDLAPLSALDNLEALSMYRTSVTDLAPLFEVNSLLFLTDRDTFDDEQIIILTDKGVFWKYLAPQ